MKALNSKGGSDFSNEIATTTKVDKIPSPDQVTFDPSTRTLSLNVGSTCLALVGVVESLVNGHTTMATWQVVETIPLHISGNGPTYKETIIDLMAQSNRMGRNSGRSLGDEINDNPGVPQVDELNPRVRVKLCLRVNHEHCGEYTEAESEYFYSSVTRYLCCVFRNLNSFLFQLGHLTSKKHQLWRLRR